MTRESGAGSDGRISFAGAGSSRRIDDASSAGDCPRNGRTPVASSYKRIPSEKMSVRWSIAAPDTCSGDMYAGVPRMAPAEVAETGRRFARELGGLHLRQSEIEHLHGAVLAHLDVRGLQIAMDDALFVRGFEGFGDLPRNEQRLVDGNGPTRDAIGQRRAVDELHDERGRAVAPLQAMDVRDVRVIEGREDPRLALEARQAFGVTGHDIRQDLDRDVALQIRVVCAIHLAHSAGPEKGDNLVQTSSRPTMAVPPGALARASAIPAAGVSRTAPTRTAVA